MKSRLAVLALSSSLVACTTTANNDDDDTPPADAPGGERPECSAMFPRTVEPQAFTAPAGLEARITSFIDAAQSSLDIQMYLFTVSSIRTKVIAAKNRGVAVRVLLDPDHDGNTSTRNQLMNAGVQTRNAPTLYSFSHAKYLIADGDTAMVMSANFNVDAMDEERNYGFIDRDPQDLKDLKAIFDMDWKVGGGEATDPADLSCTRLIVSPNNAKARVLQLIESAKTTLEVEALYVSETETRDAIVAAHERGVNVRVILDAVSDDSGAIPYFKSKGIATHASSGFFLHAKLIIADGVAFVGSENYSITSLTKNREVGALIFEPAQAQIIQTQFDADFSSTN
jgi:phosphatidylserine/phosphatidylglycerophosphate/cardiolipin synthase-like enzyme